MNPTEAFLWSDGIYRTTPEPATAENIIKMRGLADQYKRERDEAVELLKKYICLVVAHEGVDFISEYANFTQEIDEAGLTSEEFHRLEELACIEQVDKEARDDL